MIQYDRTSMYIQVKPVYEAISYTWGDPTTTQLITLDQITHLPISENVAKMLRYFRRRGKSRYVWIDALCLDQNNHAEKSQQINRMDSIYRLAGKVKIWLGEAEPVADISGSFGLFSGLYHLGTEDTSEDFHHALIRSTKIPPQSLTLFFSRPWFSRRWVLQEAVLCPFTSVQCGIFSVPWIHLRDSVRIIESLCVNHNGKSNFSNSQTVLNSFIAELRVTSASREVMRVLCRLQNSKEQLLTLLWDFDTSRCTDPGDKLRALYGLGDIPPLVLDKINADSSFHWSALFEGFAKYLIENEQSWQLISHLFAFGSLRLNDSSWSSFTPDWSRKRLDGFLSRKSAELSAFVSRVKTRLSFCQPVWQGGNQRSSCRYTLSS